MMVLVLWQWEHPMLAEQVAEVVLRALQGSLPLIQQTPAVGVLAAAGFPGGGLQVGVCPSAACQPRSSRSPQRPGWRVGVADAPQTLVEGTRGFAQDHPAQKWWSQPQARQSGSSVDSYIRCAHFPDVIFKTL